MRKGRIMLKIGTETNANVHRMVNAVWEELAEKFPVCVERGGFP